MYNLRYFVAKKFFFAIYAVFRKIGLLQFTRYCVEKILAKNSDRGEKWQIWGMIQFGSFGRLCVLWEKSFVRYMLIKTGRRYVESSSVKDGGRLSRILVIEQNDLGELRNFVWNDDADGIKD